MPETLDIHRVISSSTSNVTLDDLTKKGFKQVKVLNQVMITRLIGEAVDRVLDERSREISREERDKVIQESRSQFEVLAKRRLEKERTRIDDLERANQSALAEIESLKSRLEAVSGLEAARDQALARAGAAEAELEAAKRVAAEGEARRSAVEAEAERSRVSCERAEVQSREAVSALARKATESERERGEARAKLEEARALLGERDTEAARIRSVLSEAEARLVVSNDEREVLLARAADLESKVREREGAVDSLRDNIASLEKNVALLEGLLAAKEQDLERLRVQPAAGQAATDKLLETINDRLEKMAKPSEVSQIMLSLDGLSRRLSNYSPGGSGGSGGMGAGRDAQIDALFAAEGTGAVETNITKVTVKEAKAGGVKGALAKLKKLHKGGEDGPL